MHVITGTLLSAPLPSLLVLSNIEPPPLTRNTAVDKLIEETDLHVEWPLHNYVYRKNWNIILTIFTKNRGLVARVRIIHVK